MHPRTLALSVLLLAAGSSVATSSTGVEQPTALIAFDRYHTIEQIETYLEAVTERHSDIAELLEIGRSRAGRRILAVQINTPATGDANEKPAFYVDGNIHGGEVLGGEAALYFIDAILSGYGNDPAITALVNTSALYIVPIVNPDGRAISIDTPENHRWNLRPTDEDGDGLQDEDPPEDLDGDGRILRMRVIDPDGSWAVSTQDPRQMVRRDSEEASDTTYRLLSEGIDNDNDGRFNEDRIGGVDLNRNFPANWSPAQFASGPYPLSEPETHALVEYITSRPNIAAIHTFHTSGGLLLRFPTLADQDWDFPQADLEDYNAIAKEGVALTGYANFAYEKQTIVDLMSPGHGVFNDWASKVFGVLAMTTELWAHPMGRDGADLLGWNDEVLAGKGFVPWYRYEHPQLGPVELGGWDRWSTASPPEHLIVEEVERNFQWVLTFAAKLPRVAVLETSARPVPNSDLLEIRAVVANTGWMPTATAHAAKVLGIARPVRVRLELTGAEIVTGASEVELGVLPGARDAGPERRTVSWRIHVTDRDGPPSARLSVVSEKAGTARARIDLRPASSHAPTRNTPSLATGEAERDD